MKRVYVRPDEIREAKAITGEYWEDDQRLDVRVRFPNNTQVDVTVIDEFWKQHPENDNGFDLGLEEEVAKTFTAFPDRFPLPEEKDDKPSFFNLDKVARERKMK